MKIKLSELKKIIREELKVLREVEVVNRDTGETLTMPWEFEEEYDDGEELPDSAFKALRRDIDKLSSKSQKNDLDGWDDDDDLDAPMSDLERKVSRQVRDELAADDAGDAVTDLTDLAFEAGQDWMEDNPDADIADVAHDLASGMKTTNTAQWKLAVKYFDGKEPELISYLAKMMTM